MRRYAEEPAPYGRRETQRTRHEPPVTRRGPEQRDSRESREPRDARASRESRDYPMDDPMDDPMDYPMDSRPEPRANVGSRVVERPSRGPEPQGDQIFYQDPRTGQVVQQMPASRRTPYDDEMQEPPARARPPTMDPGLSAGQPRPSYNEYFVPDTGIEREVIQRDICMYLGNDATVRPGRSEDNRTGYIVKAYRALTSEMLRSLQQDTSKLLSERERRRKQGRAEVSYQELQADQGMNYYDRMDEDDRTYAPPPPRMGGRDMDTRDLRDPRDLRELRDTRDMRDLRDPRDPRGDIRAPMVGRHGPPIPVTTSYMPDPSYPGQYALASAPIGHSMQQQFEPRSYVTGGNTPPSIMRAPQGGYPPMGYPARATQATMAPSMTVPSYRDAPPPRMTDHHYADEPRRRR